MSDPQLHLGVYRTLHDDTQGGPARLPAHHLVTHSVVVGMTDPARRAA
jgi:hypothetical protein